MAQHRLVVVVVVVIIIIIIFIFFDAGTQFPRNEKITLCNIKKYKNQAGMNLIIIIIINPT